MRQEGDGETDDTLIISAPHAVPNAAVAGQRLQRAPRPELTESPRIASLQRDISARPANTADLVSAFWEQVRDLGTPLIEPAPQPGHVVATFLWRGTPPGDPAPTEAVLALINRVTDRRSLADSALTQLPATDVWHLSYRMRSDWLASYQLAPNTPLLSHDSRAPGTAAGPNGAGAADVGPQPHETLLIQARPDPLAREGLDSIWGGPGMSAVFGPDAPRRDCWQDGGDRPARGQLSRLRLAEVGPGRAGLDAWLYEPQVPAPVSVPLLVMLDGQVWAEVADLCAALDRLICAGQLPPMAALMLSAPVGPARAGYFGCSAQLLDDLTGPVLDEVRRRRPISAEAGDRLICGQSMGGLGALWVASQAPQVFGAALSQSGSFWWPSHDVDSGQAQWLTGQLAQHPPRGLRVDLSVGTRESLLLGPTRRLRDVLHDSGCEVRLSEYNGGHDLLWWRTAVTDALVRVLGAH